MKLSKIIGIIGLAVVLLCVLTAGCISSENSPDVGYVACTEGDKYYDAGDFENALKFYTIAAEAGNGDALNSLGLMYSRGEGVEENQDIAFDYYLQSANAGYNYGMYNLAGRYYSGKGTSERNIPLAFEWNLKAAEAGICEAMHKVALMYYRGIGTSKSVDEALIWLKKGADASDEISTNNLGWFYLKGYGMDKPDYQQAYDCFKRAADVGVKEANINLGYCYEKGLGVTEDKDKAFSLYTQAMNDGYKAGALNVARLYLEGTPSTPKDEKKGFQILDKLYVDFYYSNSYTPAAQYLGYCYLNGVGTTAKSTDAVRNMFSGYSTREMLIRDEERINHPNLNYAFHYNGDAGYELW